MWNRVDDNSGGERSAFYGAYSTVFETGTPHLFSESGDSEGKPTMRLFFLQQHLSRVRNYRLVLRRTGEYRIVSILRSWQCNRRCRRVSAHPGVYSGDASLLVRAQSADGRRPQNSLYQNWNRGVNRQSSAYSSSIPYELYSTLVSRSADLSRPGRHEKIRRVPDSGWNR